MTTAYDAKGLKIGRFDGKFVYDLENTKCYWVDDNEVFSISRHHREDDLSKRTHIKIADISDGTAITPDGNTLFTLK